MNNKKFISLLPMTFVVNSLANAHSFNLESPIETSHHNFANNRIVKSHVMTQHHGLQQITFQKTSDGRYILRDPTRGKSISTIVNSRYGTKTVTDNNRNFSGISDLEKNALDAHYVTQQWFDLFKEEFDWYGIDNKGGMLTVSLGAPGVNGVWLSEIGTSIGQGNCTIESMATADVIGHEFMHGVVEQTSAIGVSAINEGIADIMGKYLEYKIDPSQFSWEVGNYFDRSTPAFRILNNPNKVNMPSYYEGQFWDETGMHGRGAVASQWFVLLAEGGKYVNEVGEAYNLEGLGMDRAAQIVFVANKDYLREASYQDFLRATTLAAQALYGEDAFETDAVKTVWQAVGVKPAVQITGIDLSIDRGESRDRGLFEFCGTQEFHPITIKVTNYGSEDYDPENYDLNNKATLSLSTSSLSETRHLVIDKVIKAGQSTDIVIDDWYIEESTNRGRVETTLTFPFDENDTNHSHIKFYQVYAKQRDISLTPSRLLVNPQLFSETLCGLDGEYQLSFEIMNNSCAVIRKGSQIKLSLQNIDGEQLHTFDYQVPHHLKSSERVMETFSFNLGNKRIDSPKLQLNFIEDADETNNSVDVAFRKIPVIDTNFQFQSQESYVDDFIQLDQLDGMTVNTSLGLADFVKVNNQTFLGFTGQSFEYGDVFGGVGEHCEVKENAFPRISGIAGGVPYSAEISLCVDTRNMSNSALSFDLVQYRNDLLFDSPNSSMLSLSWQGIEPYNEIISGQAEGETIHHVRNLPEGFYGEILLRNYNEIGFGFLWGLDESEMLTYDSILIDNIKITDTSAQNE
ncbi:MAG: M4 family metallopeptidase [Pseudomonadota bacterium]